MRPLLLPILADALESAGFPLGVDWHLRARQLLDALPGDVPDRQLRDALCAITATNADEQQQFREIFEQTLPEWKRRIEEYDLEPPEIKKAPPPAPDDNGGSGAPSARLPWILLAAASLVLAAALLCWRYCRQTPAPETVSSEVRVVAGRNSVVAPDSTVLRDFGMPVSARFDDGADTLRATALAGYSLRDSGRVLVQARDSPGSDTLRIRLENQSGKTRLWQLVTRIEQGGVSPPPPGPPDTPFAQLQYLPDDRAARDSLLLTRRLQEHSALQQWLTRNQWPLKIALWLLLAGALYGWLQWRERRRPLTAARERADQPPYVWDIRLDDERAPELSDAFYAIANRLRRREAADSRRLDLPRTIEATIERGGLPDFRFRELTRPPEYLLLIDRQDANDHRAALFDTIAAAFKKQEVLLERFFFIGDPRLCWNDDHPAGIGIRDLLYRYPSARLILLSDGYRLLSGGRLAPWTQTLDAWKQRALFTPVPPVTWRHAERRLAERFTVLPALLDSLDFLTELDQHVETGLFPLTDLAAATGQSGHPAGEPPVALGGPLIATLREYYSDAQIRWMAACAVWPSIHYDLTLWIGRWLRNPKTQGPAWRRHEPVLSRLRRLFSPHPQSAIPNPQSAIPNPQSPISTEDLRQLTRLEWFVQGRIPDHDRLALLEWLEQDSPGLLRRIQAALYRLLAAQKAPDPKSVASPTYRMHLALLGWMSAADPAERARHAEEVKKYIGRARPDVTTLKALRRRTLLDVLVPPQLRRQVHPGGFPALGWTPFWRDALRAGALLLAAGIGALLWQPQPPACAGEQVQYQGQTLCLQNAADRALYRERLACDTIRHSLFPIDVLRVLSFVDSLTGTTRAEIPPGDTARAAYEHYVATALYNRGVTFSRQADSVFAKVPAENPGYRWAKSTPCTIFQLALDTDSSLTAARPGLDWCADSLTADSDRSADTRTRYLVQAFRDLFAQKGYVFEENYLNIIGFRKTTGRVPDAWEDYLLVLYRDNAGTWQSGVYTAATMPGVAAVQSADSRGGAAMIAPGQYREVYIPGTKRANTSQARPALIQIGPITIYRDKNKSYGIDAADPVFTGDNFSLQIYGVTREITTPDRVGNWSAGSIALRQNSEWNLFQQIYEAAYAAQKRPFTLTLATQTEAPAVWNYLTGGSGSDSGLTPTATDPDPATATAYLPGRRPGEDMAPVRGGTFTMGCRDAQRDGNCEDDEKPPHDVTLGDFYIDRTEVTNTQYAAFLDEYGSDKVKDGAYRGQTMIYEDDWGLQKDANGRWRPAPGKEQHPVVYVTWYGADEYARFYGLRLPTEAEWEYAARGGAQGRGFRYSGSDNLDEVGWYDGNSNSTTQPVRQKKANELGLFDMSGNVWEWCSDWYGEKYYEQFRSAPAVNPTGPVNGDYAVLRGGSYLNNDGLCRVANRNWYDRLGRINFFGFRCARAASAGGQ